MERVILHSDMNNFYASAKCMCLILNLKGTGTMLQFSSQHRKGTGLNYKTKYYI